MNNYSAMLTQARNAGFEDYSDTRNDENICGTILTNTNPKSLYNGEVLEIFENGTHAHYSQFKHARLLFSFTPSIQLTH